jgi:alpha-glucosidase
MFRSITFAFLLASFSLCANNAHALMTFHPLESPNGDFKIVVAKGPINDITIAVFYKRQLLATASGFTFELADGDRLPATASRLMRQGFFGAGEPPPPSRFKPDFTSVTQVRTAHEVKTIHGRENRVDFNEMRVIYGGVANIVFRAYNDGIAYRYEIATKKEETITIKNENVEFTFPDDYACSVQETQRAGLLRRTVAVSREIPLSEIEKGYAKPLYVDISPDLRIMFGGMHNQRRDFALLTFQPGRERTGTFNNLFDGYGNIDRTGKRTAVAALLDGDTRIRGTGNPFRTPWRFMIISSDSDTLRSLL